MPADRLLHPRLGHSVKVTGLTDFEHRVWITYQLASDDYGVMRMSAITILSANEAFKETQARAVQNALDKLAAVELVDTFTHQGRAYCFQRDWQNFQRVKHPRETMQPPPPPDALARCSPATQKLFLQHPLIRPGEVEKDFGNISETLPQSSGSSSDVSEKEKSEVGSLARARTRETANGLRLTADGLEGVQGEERLDRAFVAFRDAYPESRRKGGWRAQTAFVDSVKAAGGVDVLMSALENHRASEQWQTPRLIPNMDSWLMEERWRQRLDPPKADDTPASKWEASLPKWAQDARARARDAKAVQS